MPKCRKKSLTLKPIKPPKELIWIWKLHNWVILGSCLKRKDKYLCLVALKIMEQERYRYLQEGCNCEQLKPRRRNGNQQN